jgi:hypothetical protein
VLGRVFIFKQHASSLEVVAEAEVSEFRKFLVEEAEVVVWVWVEYSPLFSGAAAGAEGSICCFVKTLWWKTIL